MRFKLYLLSFALSIYSFKVSAQDTELWDKTVSKAEHPNIQWFKDAKFGMFIHWGLFAQSGGNWNGKNYYGISEWMMNRAKISAAEYARLAKQFNPTQFNAKEWAEVAKDAGMKYMVITAKHHEGFAMFDSRASDFNIVAATPFHKDPMKDLSQAARNAGLQFGFYYSQFLDWHEPNGGGNKWDFDEVKKNYKAYFQTKSIPQIKELLSNYGPLGMVWFDMPGGLNKDETQALINDVRKIQPNCLISSRVGNGLGDFKDYGDGEVPAAASVPGAWEALFTHNDSWGYSKFDYNFKTPKEIIRLLATVSSKGGNLILNVGPDSTGKMPEYSVKYLREVGKWLNKNGEAIYGTTHGLIAPQPWGVSTSKPGKLFLHVFERPKNGLILIPGFIQSVKKVYQLTNHQSLRFFKKSTDLYVNLPAITDGSNTVVVIEYTGNETITQADQPIIISKQFDANPMDAVYAHTVGKTQIESILNSYYFGDWKHATCVAGMNDPNDHAIFKARIIEPGDYKVILEYNCPGNQERQEGVLSINGRNYPFETLPVSNYDSFKPFMFVKQTVAVVTVTDVGNYEFNIYPLRAGKELFKLKTVWLEPVN